MFVTISHSLFSYIHAAFCHLNWWTCWCAIIFQCVLLLKIISMPWSHHMLKHNLEESGRLLCMIKRIDKIYQFEIWDLRWWYKVIKLGYDLKVFSASILFAWKWCYLSCLQGGLAFSKLPFNIWLITLSLLYLNEW